LSGHFSGQFSLSVQIICDTEQLFSDPESFLLVFGFSEQLDRG